MSQTPETSRSVTVFDLPWYARVQLLGIGLLIWGSATIHPFLPVAVIGGAVVVFATWAEVQARDADEDAQV